MPNFGSYILYLLLLTIHYSAFGFTLDIKISMCYLTLYLLLLTICQFAFGSTLDINKKNYTKLSVVLSGCFEGCKFPLSFSFSVFLLLLDRNLLPGFSTNYARFFCLFLWLCILCCVALGNIVRVYPWIVQGLTFYQLKYN